MGLFNKEKSIVRPTFDKKLIIAEMLIMLEDQFFEYKVFHSKEQPWDIMIISNVKHNVILIHGNTAEKSFQEIIVVNVLSPDEDVSIEMKDYSDGWAKYHFILSDVKTLKRKLLDLK